MTLKFKIMVFLLLLIFSATALGGYILVLKNGRKIYSSTPFDFQEKGVYVTLPNEMVLYIKNKSIDFEATKKFVKRLKARRKKRSQAADSRRKVKETTVTPQQSQPPKPSTETSAAASSREIPKQSAGTTQMEKPHSTAVKQSGKSSAVAIKASKPSIRKTAPKRITPKTDFGIVTTSLKLQELTLEELIEMAKRVKWLYTEKCSMCRGTGKSMLSTATNPIVCTYCNGTGKGGHWNDETLKVGDDCPWCVLGYDELGKGPCRHCMGTGRYLGLDKLGFINVSEKEKKENQPGKAKK